MRPPQSLLRFAPRALSGMRDGAPRACVSRQELLPLQPRLEPAHQVLKPNSSVSDGHHQIIYWVIIGDLQRIAAAIKQDFHKEPRCSLVAVHKAVVSNHAVQESSSLVGNRAMIAGIGACQCRLDQMEAADPIQSAIGKCFIMGCERIRQGQPVVPTSDRPAASTQSCAWKKPPSSRPRSWSLPSLHPSL